MRDRPSLDDYDDLPASVPYRLSLKLIRVVPSHQQARLPSSNTLATVLMLTATKTQIIIVSITMISWFCSCCVYPFLTLLHEFGGLGEIEKRGEEKRQFHHLGGDMSS